MNFYLNESQLSLKLKEISPEMEWLNNTNF